MSQQINLFNPIFKKQKKYLSAVTMAQGLGVILVGMVLVCVFADRQAASIAAEARTSEQQLKGAQAQVARAIVEFTPRQKSDTLEADIKRAEAELASQREVFDVVRKGGLGNTLGYSGYFQAFSRQISNGIWLTGLSIDGPGTEIEVRGRALQPELLPAYINRLKGESSMKGKSFAHLEMQVPMVETESKDAKGAPVVTKAQAGYVEFVLQTSVAVKDQDANPLEAPRPLGLAADTGSAAGVKK